MLGFKDRSLLHIKPVSLPLCSFGVRSPRDAMAALRRAPQVWRSAANNSLMHRPINAHCGYIAFAQFPEWFARSDCRPRAPRLTPHGQEIPSFIHAPFIEMS